MKSYINNHWRREEWLQRESTDESNVNRYHSWINTSYSNAKTTLDIGMGDGRLVNRLRKDGIKAYGVDLRETSNKNGLIIANARFLPFRDNSFDVVTECMLLADFDDFQDVPDEAYTQVIDEVIRVLKPEGGFLTSPWLGLVGKCIINKDFKFSSGYAEYKKRDLIIVPCRYH